MARENGPEKPEPAGPPEVAPPTLDTLFISLDRATGRVDIQGPIDNRVLCYGMLMLALEIVMARGMARSSGSASGRILVPR